MAPKAHAWTAIPIRTLQRLVDITLILVIAGFVILFGLQFPHSARLDSVHWVIELRATGDPIISRPAAWVGIAWPARSTYSFGIVLPLVFAFLVWVMKIGADATFLSGLRLADRLLLKSAATIGVAGAGVASLRGDSLPTSAETEEAREELLKRYREIEQALKAGKRRRCTFLSVDVVGSTTMKMGEADTDIAATFQAYEELLRNIFERYGAWKQAWTPDGVMICFLQADLGVGAAQRILEGLATVNERDTKLKTPFQVRAGMNEGEIAIYEDSKLEKVSDRVIDVAGHMQKNGPPGVLWVSEVVYDSLKDQSGFVPTQREVDGHKVYQWTPAAAGPPAG